MSLQTLRAKIATARENAAADLRALPPAGLRRRHGAIGKALIVWLLSGSLGVAVVAFLIFSMMGC